MVTVQIQYLGNFRDRAGKGEESLIVPANLPEAYQVILDHAKEKYGITPPFNLLLGKMHIVGALKKQAEIQLEEGMVFKLLPFISGG